MSGTLELLVIQGPMKGRRFTFVEPTRCVFGRGPDCFPRFPDKPEYRNVSRRHCRMDVDPPGARLRDLGSLNGTWLNGRNIGGRGEGEKPEDSDRKTQPEHNLNDGDEVRIGDMVFQVRQDVEQVRAEMPPRRCASCGRHLASKAGAFHLDGFLCSGCQKNPEQVVGALLTLADKGAGKLGAFRELEIVRELGRGAAGAAYLVKQQSTGHQFAFKLMLPEVAVKDASRQAFLREVENARVLDHPNVVRLYDSGGFMGVFFYTMEYCNGGSLNELIYKHSGKVPLEVAGPLILQVLDGLEYIHQAEIPNVRLADGKIGRSRGLVHRDIKPANIFLSRRGGETTAKIADVGVGKAFDTAGLSGLTRTGTIAGSPVTMPRQQVINFKFARPEVDVWAAAATFYIITTGRWPRDFSPDQDPCLTVLRQKPVPVRERNASIPDKLAEVIDAALVDDPEITFKSAAEFRRALESSM